MLIEIGDAMMNRSMIAIFATCFGLLAANATTAEDFSALYKQLNPSVVTIRTTEVVGDGNGIRQQRALGSGILVDEQGFVITASHVVHTADTIIVEFADGQENNSLRSSLASQSQWLQCGPEKRSS